MAIMGGPKPGSGRSAIAANSQRIRCRISANVTLTGSTPTPVPWDVEDYKFGITHDVAVNNDRIVIVTPGLYLVAFTASLGLTDAPSVVDPMEAYITVGGVASTFGSNSFRPELAGVWPFDDNTVVGLVVTSILSLAAGAIVRGVVMAPTQTTGSPVLRRDGDTTTNGATHIDIHRLS